MNNCEITLVIPVYEEEHNIIPFITEVAEKVEPNYYALIIYDYDDDNTLNKMQELMQKHHNVKFVKNMYAPGVINAFKTGFHLAETKYILPIMADLSDMPETVNVLYKTIKTGFDIVIASRYMLGGGKIGGSRIKNFLSRVANLSLYYLANLPTHDLTNAFVIYKKEILKDIVIKSSGGFELTMEIISKALFKGYRITEIPTVNQDRSTGKSKFKLLRWIANYFYWYIYILYHSILFRIANKKIRLKAEDNKKNIIKQ